LLSAALILALTACGGESGTGRFQLDGTSWVLVAYDQLKPIESTTPPLLFDTGQVYSGVNCKTIGGGYSVEGNRIYFGALYMTENTCQEPEGSWRWRTFICKCSATRTGSRSKMTS
jgi:heat shock protein HslJ